MPMKDEEKAELTEIFSQALVNGLKAFRSETEEEEAKAQQEKADKDKGTQNDNAGGTTGNGFSFRGFLLGE